MKSLKVRDQASHFSGANSECMTIDNISKMEYCGWSTKFWKIKEVKFDRFDEATIKSQAHQII